MAAAKTRVTPNADMIRAYETHLESLGRSPRTIKAAVDLLYRLDRELPEGIARAVLHELKTWLAHRDWSVQTRATYRNHIVEFFRWAVDEDDPWLTYNPAASLHRPRVPVGIADPTPDDVVQRSVTEAAEPFRLICILAAYAGLRPMEIAALRREDVSENWITIRAGKGNKRAIVPTEPPVWRAVCALPPGVLVHNSKGGVVTARWVTQRTAEYIRKTFGADTTLRHYRHWHGTWLRRHYDLRVVQERMRHASLATTQIYTAVTQAELASSTGWLPDFTATGSDDPDRGGQAA